MTKQCRLALTKGKHGAIAKLCMEDFALTEPLLEFRLINELQDRKLNMIGRPLISIQRALTPENPDYGEAAAYVKKIKG